MSNTISSQDYFTEVKSIAIEVFNQIMGEYENDIESVDYDCAFYDCLSEYVDSHEWVIYNHYNLQVLQHASNPEAMIDELGAESAGHSLEEGGLSTLHCHLAFWALKEDVNNALQELIEDWEPEEQDEDEE